MERTSRESEHRVTQNALFSDYCPAGIAEARERQDRFMTERFAGRPLRIADLGCGDGYHGSIFGRDCELYHAFELAPAMARMARERFARERLDKARLFEADVCEVPIDKDFYDLVICMYFTPGNFRDVSDDMGLYTDEYLDHNPVFARIMARFYRALRAGGQMYLTVYKDKPRTEAQQLDFYLKTGQHPVTPPGSRFVATAEGFWSARWTRQSMLSNLADAGIAAERVVFHDLNEIAWLVEISRDRSPLYGGEGKGKDDYLR